MVPEVEDHNPLGGLGARVPCGKCPEAAGDEARLGDTQQEAGTNERGVVCLECLKCADGAKEEELESKPKAGTDAVERHVGGDFEKNDTQREHLLADVELVLCDVDVFHEVVGDGVGDVAAVELQAEEAEGE